MQQMYFLMPGRYYLLHLHLFRFKNVQSGTYLDLDSGSKTNGMEWAENDKNLATYLFLCPHRDSGSGLGICCKRQQPVLGSHSCQPYLFRGSHHSWKRAFYPQELHFFELSRRWLVRFLFLIVFILLSLPIRYIVIPDDALGDSYSNSNLSQNQWRDQIFECVFHHSNIHQRDYELILPQSHRRWLCNCCQSCGHSVGQWFPACRCTATTSLSPCPYMFFDANFFCQGITVLFGITFGQISGENCSYNWYLNSDLDKVVYFDPQNGTEVKPPSAFKESFNLF